MDPEIQILLDRYIDGTELTAEEVDRLSAWVSQSRENALYFTELMEVDHHLGEFAGASDIHELLRDADQDGGALHEIINEALARRQMNQIGDELARLAEAERADRMRLRALTTARAHDRGPRVVVIPRPIAWAAIAAAVALLCTGVWWVARPDPSAPGGGPAEASVAVAPRPLQPQAWVVQQIDTRWDDALFTPDDEGALVPGEYALDTGTLKLRTRLGVDVVIAAPVRFSVTESNGLHLREGQLVATVPERAHGFYIDTPFARVVDFGTEFGVSLDSRNTAEVHVYTGEVRSSARVDGELLEEQRPVYQGQAVRVSDNGLRTDPVDFTPERFVRRVTRPLDVADIIAGGDGTGDAADRGIHPGTGGMVYKSYDGLTKDVWQIMPGRRQYNQVGSNRMIDGVFTIDPGMPEVAVDSVGTRYTVPADAILGLSKELAFGPIWAAANGKIPSPASDGGALDQPFTNVGRPELDRRILVMHPNVGMTIDLDAVRDRFTSFEPARLHFKLFHAGGLFQDTVRGVGTANLAVLIDGQPAFQRVGFASRDGVIEVDVSVQADARFLTLMTTSGPDGSNGDWVLLSETTLDIEPDEREVSAAIVP